MEPSSFSACIFEKAPSGAPRWPMARHIRSKRLSIARKGLGIELETAASEIMGLGVMQLQMLPAESIRRQNNGASIMDSRPWFENGDEAWYCDLSGCPSVNTIIDLSTTRRVARHS